MNQIELTINTAYSLNLLWQGMLIKNTFLNDQARMKAIF